MHACDGRTDGRTDGQMDGKTEFSSLYRVCITCVQNTQKCFSGRGSAPDPAWGTHDAHPNPLVSRGRDTPPHIPAFGASHASPGIPARFNAYPPRQIQPGEPDLWMTSKTYWGLLCSKVHLGKNYHETRGMSQNVEKCPITRNVEESFLEIPRSRSSNG